MLLWYIYSYFLDYSSFRYLSGAAWLFVWGLNLAMLNTNKTEDMFLIKEMSLLEDCKTIELVTLGKGTRDSDTLEAKIEDFKWSDRHSSKSSLF